ncbi:hypothetical protein Sjap_003228 [Stephania japonica]|uniref:Cytochrome P450 n=1 Tax=Stephania japonica TaxID=461633 RepID=A0AAP0KPX5_9MAGN
MWGRWMKKSGNTLICIGKASKKSLTLPASGHPRHFFVLPLIKSLTFNIICSLLFGLEPGTRREKFLALFQRMIEGMWSVPVNLPFTRFNRSLKASLMVRKMVADIVNEKRVDLEQGKVPASHDLITKLLSIRDEGGAPVVSEKEIVDNVMLVMVAGYDTSSVLITFMVRLLANDPDVYAAMLHEQEEIAKSKAIGEPLTWEDVSKMKYTWRVALETLRIFPPVFGGFRKALKDIEFGGYLIPKGWQIFWAANMTQRDESIFPDSMKFDPTRFDQNIASIPPYCFVAFGAGQRICPGYEFARFETLVVMHYLLARFTWKLCCSNHSSSSKDNDFSRDPMPVFPQGLLIQVRPICNIAC